jgi:uncharacterized protein (DUF924 family)
MEPQEAEDVLHFWFGALDQNGRADPEHTQAWYKRDSSFDALIATRFGAVHAAAVRGERDTWLETPRARLALVILFDQFSRNLYRNDPAAFENDARALSAAREAVDRGIDRGVEPRFALDERVFFYMPFMHSEDLADQDRCIALFSALSDEQPEPLKKYADNFTDFARRHQVIVARFGRFPHRNAVLGRESTPEEVEFLKQPGSSF